MCAFNKLYLSIVLLSISLLFCVEFNNLFQFFFSLIIDQLSFY